MTRETRINSIKDWLLHRRAELGQFMAGELAMLGTDEDYDSLDDEEYVVMAVSESKELGLLNAAIKRMSAGTYGICEECETEIPLVRLKALPCATNCIECQRSVESGVESRKVKAPLDDKSAVPLTESLANDPNHRVVC